jgi:serine/threonine protein kinase
MPKSKADSKGLKDNMAKGSKGKSDSKGLKEGARGMNPPKEGISEAKKGNVVLLAQGTFGCVFHPGMTCNHEPLDAEYITKIHASNEKTVQNEIAVSKKVQTIPNYEQYFSPILENCKVNLAKVNRKEVEKCKFIDADLAAHAPVTNQPLTYVSTKIRFIKGESLLEYVSQNSKYSTISFLYKTLCESVKKLAEKDIVHFDLRENNMIVSKKGVPIIIDFGISIDFTIYFSIDFSKTNQKKTFLKNTFYAYTTQYKPWCIEIVLICYIVHRGNPTSEKIMEIFDEVMQNNDFANKPYLKEDFPKYREQFKTQISIKPPQQLLEHLLSTYKRWDLYSVTILLIQMLEKTGQKPDETHVKQIKAQILNM